MSQNVSYKTWLRQYKTSYHEHHEDTVSSALSNIQAPSRLENATSKCRYFQAPVQTLWLHSLLDL